MQIAYELLKYLKDGRFHSGTALSTQLGVARGSVWKGVRFLMHLGLDIYAVPGRGYRLAEPIEMLEASAIQAALTPPLTTELPYPDVLNLTPSTNEYLVQAALRRPALPTGTVCVAEGQSAGRGRLGRQWLSPYGANLYFSIFWRFKAPVSQQACLSLVVGIATLKAVQALNQAPLPALKLKWPNDLMYAGRKLGGILVEQVPNIGTVIGIGINVTGCASLQRQVTQPVAALSQILTASGKQTLSRNQLAATLITELVAAFEMFEDAGFTPFQATWGEYDALKGQIISVKTPRQAYTGECLGINARGELCLQVNGTKKAIISGEVTINKKIMQ